MKIYEAGPMTGKHGYNYDEFNHYAEWIKDRGYEPLNPAVHFDGSTSHPAGRKAFMREGFKMILEADAIAVLPGWQDSVGAMTEVAMGRELSLPILDVVTLEPFEETAGEEAVRLVRGARQSSYGHPFDDFTRTGKIWGAILGTGDVPPDKVALCLIGVKVSREVNGPKHDNVVDIAGYAETLALVRERQAERTVTALEQLMDYYQGHDAVDPEVTYAVEGNGKPEWTDTKAGDDPDGAPI